MEDFKDLKSIDWQLSLSLVNDRTDTAIELLNMLVEELPRSRHEINQAYEEKNYQKLQQQAHKLHGATCYCGVPRLKEIAKHLEIALKKNDKSQLPDLLLLLNKEIEQVLQLVAANQFQNL